MVAPEYDENSGGIVAQHKLIHLLNKIGYESYIHPFISARLSTPNHRLNPIYYGWKDDLQLLKYRLGKKFRTNPSLNTPVIHNFKNTTPDDWIVIYPEIVAGNPLGANNVVRWLLHQPGYFSKLVCYGRGEIYYKYAESIKDFHIDGSTTSKNILKIIHYPTEHYNTNNVDTNRNGVAYCIRKGGNKPRSEIPPDAILIDGLSHKEISTIFKRVKTFISYDDYTAYTLFALMCGCDCIVVPTEGVTEEEWQPNPTDRYGIAYGTDRLEWARSTAHLQLKQIEQINHDCENIANKFADEAHIIFSKSKDMGYISQRKR